MATVRLPDGPTLTYEEWGRPDGAVVLLLHGLEEDSDSWRNVAPALGEHFRVLAPDARGHGGSEWTQDYSVELMRDDVVGLMDALGILAAVVDGYSMGGSVAYLLAATHPDRVRMLVLEEVPPPDPADPPRPLPRQPDPDATTDWRAVIAWNRWRNAPPPRGWEDHAKQIEAPTLVVGGVHSHLSQSRLEDLTRQIPDATYTAVDTDHRTHQDRPSGFLRVVEPFLAPLAV